MSSSPESSKSLEETREEKFLAGEYQALFSLDSARNSRLDSFLTLFITVAAAPWALYAFTLKDHSGVPTISTIPSLVALAFVLTGILGALIAMMYIQVWFTIVMYMRAVNAIRGHFLEAHTRLTFHLPVVPSVPPYYARGSYIQFAVNGMALVNSGYIGLGLFNMWRACPPVRVGASVLLSGLCWLGHGIYYSSQARKREGNSQGAKELRWGKS